MNFLIVFFFAFNHINHIDLSCVECHDFKNPKRILKTEDKESCNKCHKSNPKKYVFEFKESKGIKFDHEKHQFLSCDTCHELKKKVSIPNMKNCVSCHDDKKNTAKPNCVLCHEYNNKFITRYKNKIYIPKSHFSYNYKNRHSVTNENYCLQCHKKRDCEECHNSSFVINKSQRFHSPDYLYIHQYEKNLNNCSSCHKDYKDCRVCHQKSGIDNFKLKREIRDYKIHPDNWNHGVEAYRNINSCVTCHKQDDCLQCHKEGINPHKKVKNICDKADKKEQFGCQKCHRRVEDICP